MIQKAADNIVNNPSEVFANSPNSSVDSNITDDDFEIIFDNIEPTLDSQGNGGAITEHYDTPAIKKSDNYPKNITHKT